MEPVFAQSIIMRMRTTSESQSPSGFNQFQATNFETLETISQSEIKQELRQFMIKYEEYVGIHLKSKKFIGFPSWLGTITKRKTNEKSQ